MNISPRNTNGQLSLQYVELGGEGQTLMLQRDPTDGGALTDAEQLPPWPRYHLANMSVLPVAAISFIVINRKRSCKRCGSYAVPD